MSQHLIMDKNGIRRTLVRLSNEIVERIGGIENTVLLGIKRGGEIVAKRIASRLTELEGVEVPCGGLDITLERDDLVSEFFVPDYSGNELGVELTG